MTDLQITVPVIGIIHSPLKQKFGTPRQPNLVDVSATIEMLSPYNDIQAFEGIAQFSHLWLLWQFHQNRVTHKADFRASVRPPRLGGNQKIGVFATRSMYRPANIGLSVVRFSHIEKVDDKLFIHIKGGDMIDGTPIIDIKPYLNYSDSIPDATSGYATDAPTNKAVIWDLSLSQHLSQILITNSLSQNDLTIIKNLIAQDPRPAYRQQEMQTQFVMRYQTVDIGFNQIDEYTLKINSIISVNVAE